MKTRATLALLALIALTLTAAGCARDMPEGEDPPGNDPGERTDLTVQPMHNYADDAEEDINEENAEDELDQLSSEVQNDIEGMER